MAENETTVAEETEQSETPFAYPVTVEDAGPGTKKVSVEIPRERIDEKIKEQFKELRQQAAIPGFRPGHAPQKLVEKRFGSDVKDQVRRNLISESYQQALENNKLEVIGEPDFKTYQDPENIKIPDEGNLTYSFAVEVRPDFQLPDLTQLKVKKHKFQIGQENIEQALTSLREQQGTLVPIEDRGVEAKDYLISDVEVKIDGNVVANQHDAEIVARPGRIAGFQIDDLGDQLAGLKAGESRTVKVKVPDTFSKEEYRGKDAEIEIKLKDLKKLELAEVNETFLADIGFDSEEALREALRQQMVDRIESDVRQSMREQTYAYLLENTPMEVPAKLTEKQADRVVSRRAINLLTRGVPRDQVEANLERLRSGATEEGVRELKLHFILNKIANDMDVEVDEQELNGQIAMLAVQHEDRPERLKQEMASDGRLMNLYIQMREQKAIDKLLETAQVEEVEVEKEEKK